MDAPLQLSETAAAYLAGIIDGEGHVGLERLPPSGKGVQYLLRVQVKTTSEALSAWLVGVTEFGNNIQKLTDARGDRQTTYRWVVCGERARQVLEAILPYLVIKRALARIAIEYQALSREEKIARGVEYCERVKDQNLKRAWARTVGRQTSAGTPQPPCGVPS